MASIENMLEIAQQRLSGSMSSSLHGAPLTVESLCDAALAGDQLARDIILGVGHSVGRILAIMVNLFNPEDHGGLAAQPRGGDPAPGHRLLHSPTGAADYSEQVKVESTQFFNQGTMPGAALVKEALYNGSLLVQLLQG